MRAFAVIALVRVTLTDPAVRESMGRLLASQLSAVRWSPRIADLAVAGEHATRSDGVRLHVVYRCHLAITGVASADEAQQAAFDALHMHVPTLRWPPSLGVERAEVLSAITTGVER